MKIQKYTCLPIFGLSRVSKWGLSVLISSCLIQNVCLAQDADSDGLLDIDEIVYGTDPQNSDTDSDSVYDGDEVYVWGSDPTLWDTDGDGSFDGEEVAGGYDPVDPNSNYGNDPYADHDGDGLSTGYEYSIGTDPGWYDSDGDLLDDGTEVLYLGTDPLLADTDNDDLTDPDELYTYYTDPTDPDTDNDGVSDGMEIVNYTDPLDPYSF